MYLYESLQYPKETLQFANKEYIYFILLSLPRYYFQIYSNIFNPACFKDAPPQSIHFLPLSLFGAPLVFGCSQLDLREAA